MAFAFIFGTPDCQTHVPVSAVASNQDQSRSTSTRMQLQRPAWLNALLAAASAPEPNVRRISSHGIASRMPDRARDKGRVFATVLVQLRPGIQYKGPLTPWTREELLLWDYQHRPH